MHPFRLAAMAIVCMSGCGEFPNAPRPLAKTATLDLYVASGSPTPNSINAIDLGNNSPIFLVTPAIISAADIASIQRSENSPDMPSLTVTLTPPGAKKLAAATAIPAGRQLAIVFNGTVVAVPKLLSPLSNVFVVTGGEIAKNREKFIEALTKEP